MSGTPNQIRAVPRLRGGTPIPSGDLVLSVLVPVYNERETIEVIIDQVHAVGVRKQVICVDDRSTDGTLDVLQQLRTKGPIDVLIRHEVNRGKGAAILTALAALWPSVCTGPCDSACARSGWPAHRPPSPFASAP